MEAPEEICGKERNQAQKDVLVVHGGSVLHFAKLFYFPRLHDGDEGPTLGDALVGQENTMEIKELEGTHVLLAEQQFEAEGQSEAFQQGHGATVDLPLLAPLLLVAINILQQAHDHLHAAGARVQMRVCVLVHLLPPKGRLAKCSLWVASLASRITTFNAALMVAAFLAVGGALSVAGGEPLAVGEARAQGVAQVEVGASSAVGGVPSSVGDASAGGVAGADLLTRAMPKMVRNVFDGRSSLAADRLLRAYHRCDESHLHTILEVYQQYAGQTGDFVMCACSAPVQRIVADMSQLRQALLGGVEALRNGLRAPSSAAWPAPLPRMSVLEPAETPAPASSPSPGFMMCRSLSMVADLWPEWTEDLGVLRSVEAAEQQLWTAWRKADLDKMFYYNLKPTIRRIATAPRIPLVESVAILEGQLLSLGTPSLDQLMKAIKAIKKGHKEEA
ncbi:hypothetical protein BDK51DRAFT_48816 [Blyttiomyces helicus]|uniref:Transcription activator GCR1-like domain-containing protein n=1 Tax=Blyttiomyces helicus TaxID=388810 RepID=A0A4P9WBL4_9FUNG|nr:hypothetical protein BDK51DRAFT_48816 [Blyttiomyces helicus]|eukprot:RKO87686.1 hypothetical protein BDK51DRAFT_48816 [Blyttiomyces helicus]